MNLHPFTFVKTPHGIHIESHLLQLEGEKSDMLNVSCSLTPYYTGSKVQGKQIICHNKMIPILQKRYLKQAFLPLEYDHPISIGDLSLQLLPSGESLGSSFVYLQKKQQSLFYASYWSMEKTPSLIGARFKKADQLLIKIPYPFFPQTPPLEFQKFMAFARKMNHIGEQVILVIQPVKESLYLYDLLLKENFSVAFSEELHAFFKNIPQPSSSLPGITFVSRYHLIHGRMKKYPTGIWCETKSEKHENLNIPLNLNINISDSFFMCPNPNLTQWLSLIEQVSPQHLFIDAPSPIIELFEKEGVPCQKIPGQETGLFQ